MAERMAQAILQLVGIEIVILDQRASLKVFLCAFGAHSFCLTPFYCVERSARC